MLLLEQPQTVVCHLIIYYVLFFNHIDFSSADIDLATIHNNHITQSLLKGTLY